MMLLTPLIVCLSAAALAAGAKVDDRSSFVKEYSYQVAIEEAMSLQRFVYWCAGAAVSRRIVVTTAHCLFQIDPFRLRAHVGVSGQESDRGLRIRAKEVKMHHQYLYNMPHNNIGYLRLARSLDPAIVQPIAMFRPDEGAEYVVNATATVTGWGVIEDEYKNTLYAMNISVSRSHLCKSSKVTSATEIVCHGSDYEDDAEALDNCFTDPGGLVVVDGLLVGFVTYANCNLDLIPWGMYYEIHYFIDWIYEMSSDLA